MMLCPVKLREKPDSKDRGAKGMRTRGLLYCDVIRLPADRAVTSAQRLVLTSCEESIMEVSTTVEISTRSSFTSDKDTRRNNTI